LRSLNVADLPGLVAFIAAISSDYVTKIGLRTYSDLECIPDEALRD
jgi:hypothetical protein